MCVSKLFIKVMWDVYFDGTCLKDIRHELARGRVYLITKPNKNKRIYISFKLESFEL